MQDSVYNGLFGAMTQEYRMNKIANNLANVNTTGFKKEKLAFEQVLFHYAHDFKDPNIGLTGGVIWPESDQLTQPRISGSNTVFEQGGMEHTGNAFDLAIKGPGFFQVRTPDGDFLTRNGQFSLNAQGTLVTSQGYELLGPNGPVNINPNGPVSINSQGVIQVGENIQGQIGIMNATDLSALEKRGENLFTLRENAEAQIVAEPQGKIAQGYLEKSNVNVVEEMVNMISTLRAFEANQKVMSSSSEQDSNLINRIGNP